MVIQEITELSLEEVTVDVRGESLLFLCVMVVEVAFELFVKGCSLFSSK